MKKQLLIAGLIAWPLLSAGAQTSTAEIEKNIDNLLSKMTIEQKIGQLNQRSGYGYAPDMVAMVRSGAVGSLLNEVDPEVVNKLQREAVENSELGIPLVFARDVIHGFKTIFPIPLGQAATWNPEIIEQGARIAADETTSTGIRWTFSPMVDISRDARWGRIAESFGEDPYLARTLGVAMVRGYQGDDLSAPNAMAACVKHFAGYGASESGLDYNTTLIPYNYLRDVYLPPFEDCAKAGAATFMCSFNDINGVPSSGNKHLLRDILRDEWGWNGLVVSDWASIVQMIPQGFAADLRDAARISANAGVDVDMENYAYIQHLKDLVEKGEVEMSVLDDMVRNVLRLKYRLGLFDNPYVDMKNANKFYAPASLAAAQRAAEESAILLDNKGVLPLAKSVNKVAVVGPMADAKHDQNGTWVFDLDKSASVTPLESLTKLYGKNNVFYAPGVKYSRDRSTDGIADAVKAAEKADVVLCFVGEEAVLSGEAHCRADISLPGAQTELLKALKQTGKPLVMVVMTGRPMTIADEIALADATLYTFHGGTMAGPAIANLLTGEVNPSGKLPVCMPRMVGQMPLYYARNRSGRPADSVTYIDDIELEAGQTSTGCQSFYLDAGNTPLYPFGYGMSYTTFEYGTPSLSSTEMTTDGSITVTCDITNTGRVAGAETVQLYTGDLVASRVRPEKELKGYQKVTLAPGETKTVTFTVNAKDLAFYTLENKTAVEPGDFNLWVAKDCASGSPVKFTVK